MRSRSEQQKAERRQEILDAAVGLFAANGFSATGISAVAQVAGVSHGTVFLYFPNKEALFEAAILEPMVEAEEAFRQVVEAPGTPRERIVRMVHQQVMTFARKEAYLRLVHYVLGQRERFPQLAQRCFDFSRHYLETLRPVIEEGQRLGQIRAGHPDTMTAAYFSYLNGIGLTVMAPPDHPTWPDFVSMGLRLFGITEEATTE